MNVLVSLALYTAVEFSSGKIGVAAEIDIFRTY